MKVLVDTNVLLDVLTSRSPFHVAAADVWARIENGRIEGCVAAVSFTTIYYLARRLQGHALALASVQAVKDVFDTAPVDAAVIE